MSAEPAVLVVDDDKIVCDSCTRILADEGFAVETSLHARKGLEMARAKDYAAVLLDIKMEQMDGFDLLGRLHKAKPSLPVIMITGYPDAYDAATCLRAGACDYIPKPFSPDQITQSVRNATALLQPVIEAPPTHVEGRVPVEEEAVAAKRTATKVIACRVDHCLSCKSCEIACALAHSESQSLAEAVLERPRPQRRVTVEAAGARGLPLQCRHCEDAPCELVCPTGAIHREQEHGLTVVDEDLCIGCKLCGLMCPLGVLQIGRHNRATIKCDQCIDRQSEGSEPACIEACPTGALQLVSKEDILDKDRRLVAVSIAAPLTDEDVPARHIADKAPPTEAEKAPPGVKRRVVVIGSNAAGAMAAIHAAEAGAEVTVVTADPVSYRRPAIPALIAGDLEDIGDARIFSPKTLRKYGINVLGPVLAVATNTEKKTIILQTRDGEKREIPFDAMVLATGGVPARPKIPGVDKQGVCTFTTVEAALEILQNAEQAKSAVVIGASLVALEVAQALLERGLEVYFNVRSRILRRLVEPDISKYLETRFSERGLQMLTGESISEIGGSDRVEYVVHKGKKIPAELVVLGTGIWPNVYLAETAIVKLVESGAILVDKSMRTSVPDVYAAGDCAAIPDFSTGRFVYSPVGSTGAAAGAIAGTNAAGGRQETRGLLRAQADHIFGCEIYSIGHTSTTARDVGLDLDVHDLATPAGAVGHYDEVVGKLLTDTGGRIVGAQAVTQRHGSQYGWQLYRAVLLKESREAFLKRWLAPRRWLAQMAAKTDGGELTVPLVGGRT